MLQIKVNRDLKRIVCIQILAEHLGIFLRLLQSLGAEKQQLDLIDSDGRSIVRFLLSDSNDLFEVDASEKDLLTIKLPWSELQRLMNRIRKHIDLGAENSLDYSLEAPGAMIFPKHITDVVIEAVGGDDTGNDDDGSHAEE